MLYFGCFHGLVYVTVTAATIRIIPSKDVGRVFGCCLVDPRAKWAGVTMAAAKVACIVLDRVLGWQQRWWILWSMWGYIGRDDRHKPMHLHLSL